MKALPSISVVTPSYDGALVTLEKALSLVREQNYPQEKIEIVLGHGGTKKAIQPLAKKYNAKYVIIDSKKQNAEYNRGVAFNIAKGELILILDHDNFMTSSNFLREYVEPFIKEKNLVAVESAYYHYDSKMSLLDRYFSLFGVLDPVAYYLGKADRMNQLSEKWNLLGKGIDRGNYFLVEFENNARRIPTIGTNGCLMNKNLVLQNADARPEFHFPIDVMVDVIKNGYNKFAFVKNSLEHRTSSRGIVSFFQRRFLFMNEYHFEKNDKRRYSVFMKGDEWKLVYFIIISVTIVKPLYDSIRGFMKIRDLAWFLHPVMCLGMTFIYGYASLKRIWK